MSQVFAINAVQRSGEKPTAAERSAGKVECPETTRTAKSRGHEARKHSRKSDALPWMCSSRGVGRTPGAKLKSACDGQPIHDAISCAMGNGYPTGRF